MISRYNKSAQRVGRCIMVLTDIEFLINFLEERHVPVITKKKHTYLTYHGLEERYTYILKKGVIKNSIILQDGREFNLSYITQPDVISLLRDEISKYTDQPFNALKQRKQLSIRLTAWPSGTTWMPPPSYRITLKITIVKNYPRIFIACKKW